MDVIVIGNGVSSLLLAQALLDRGAADRIQLVGPEARLHPHLLAYWTDRDTPFDAHTIARWSVISVVDSDGVERRRTLDRFSYRVIRAERWAAEVRAALAASGRVGTVAGAVTRVEDGDRPAVQLGDGRRLSADWVFASHGPPADPAAWQRFAGWEVEVDHDPIELGTARLLDFRMPADGDLRFTYALPLAPRRLFVEHVSYAPCDHQAHLAAYLRALGADRWWIVDCERGTTPIFAAPPPRIGQRVVRIGVSAGLAKPATGYALMRMSRDADALARSLARRGRPEPAPRASWLHRVADRYFLDALAHEPSRIMTLLGALFARAPGDAVLAFLDDRATFLQKLAIAWAVPGWVRWWLRR